MKKRSHIIIALVFVMLTLSFSSCGKMTVPDNLEDIVYESLCDLMGVQSEDISLANIVLKDASYDITSVTAHSDHISVEAHVIAHDTKSVITQLAQENDAASEKEFFEMFSKKLKSAPTVENDVSFRIVENEGAYSAEMDMMTADAFTGGLIETLDSFIGDQNEKYK